MTLLEWLGAGLLLSAVVGLAMLAAVLQSLEEIKTQVRSLGSDVRHVGITKSSKRNSYD